MVTKYSELNKKELDNELVVIKRKYDYYSKNFELKNRILSESKVEQKGRIQTFMRISKKYFTLANEANFRLKELYYEYLSFNRNGQIPEIKENVKEPTAKLLSRYKYISNEVKRLWDKHKKIPRRGSSDGELRHSYIERMKCLEKILHERFFTY